MTSPSEPRTPQSYHAFGAAMAVKVAVAGIATIYLVQIVLSVAGAPPLVIGATGFLVTFALLVAIGARGGGVRRLGLAAARPRFYASGVLIGISAWFPNLLLVSWLATWLHLPGNTEALQRLTEQSPLGITLVAIAVVPALAEEIVFRGVLARGLATRIAPASAIVISAAVFGLYHLVPAQMIATFLLGILLALLALRAGSALPSMIAHALNNAVAITLTRDELPAASHWIEDHSAAVLAACLTALAAGVALAVVKPRVIRPTSGQHPSS
jgi:membrane protease YdiL (CAAX protease family)